MIKRTINTKLIKKEELFRIMALGECTKLPILFVGPPGVAKTQSLMDYASAMYAGDKQQARDKCFVIELDEGTKNSEIKGRVNVKELLTNNNYMLDTPIADAEYILINEVDKGSSAIRNTMLSVMRERALFLGDTIRRCQWKLFAGSCNEISDDEAEAPFWDRFVITYNVERITKDDMAEMWKHQSKTVDIEVPEPADFKGMKITKKTMNAFIDICYDGITDRTGYLVPTLIRGIKLVWKCTEAEAAIKAASFLTTMENVQKLSEKLEDKNVLVIKGEIMNLDKLEESDPDILVSQISGIENKISQYVNKNRGSEEANHTADDLRIMLKEMIKTSPNCQEAMAKMKERAEQFAKLSGEETEDIPVEATAMLQAPAEFLTDPKVVLSDLDKLTSLAEDAEVVEEA